MPTAEAADYLAVQAYATDTVAGYPSALRTSIITPNQDVRFVVEKPDGGVVQIPAQANSEGVAKADFYGHQTKIAGSYKAAVVFPGSTASSPQVTFKVYPDQISVTQSTVRSTEQLIEAGEKTSFVVVTLFDQYRNPIPNHSVKVLSSRSEDTVEALQQGVSDQNGRANFKVRSSFPGISVFTAIDMTLNKILDDRVEVVFFAPSAPSKSSLFSASLLGSGIGGDGDVLPGPVDHFEIEELPATVKVGDELSFKIVARDKNGNVAKNYTGTVLISVPDDENAVLPNNGEYSFKAADQGAFTFNLSLMFSQVGNQVVQIFDKTNFKISGEQKVEVIPKEGVIPGPSTADIAIKSPTDGSRLGTNLVILTGQGNENINLKIFDNDTKIGDSETDADGFFSFEVKSLQSGAHNFYVMTDDGRVSKAVAVTIDTLAPVLNSFQTDADGDVVPGSAVTITVQSEPKLEQAKIRIQGIEQPMTESVTESGTYEVTFAAPSQDGQFPIDVILIDSLSNKAEFSGKGTVSVRSPEAVSPPAVLGLEGAPGDSVISLAWQPVVDHEREIQKYRVYYGLSLDALNQTVDTQNSTPSWELRNLMNDTQYFIAVTAIDSLGNESDKKSIVIAATPINPDLCAAISCGDYGTCSEGSCDCDAGWSGLTCNIQDEPVFTNSVTQLTALPSNGSVLLSWPSFAGGKAYYYKVFMGFSPGQYTDYAITENNQPELLVSDLINNAQYYFAVAALDINKNQFASLSEEVSAIPSGSLFHPVASSGNSPTYPVVDYNNQLSHAPFSADTGPETLWIVFISVVFASLLYSHKKKIVNGNLK